MTRRRKFTDITLEEAHKLYRRGIAELIGGSVLMLVSVILIIVANKMKKD